METLVLKNGKKVVYEAEIVSVDGCEIYVHTKLTAEEKKEVRYELQSEGDVLYIHF